MKRIVIAAMALSLLGSTVAFADPPPWAGSQGHDDHHEWRHDHHDHEHDHGRHHYEHDRGEHRGWRFSDAGYYRPPGYRYHRWERGERLPPAYRAPQYIVVNPYIYHLAPPPPGYYWVRVDNNAVLAAVATGVVLNVAFHLFH